MDPVTAAIVGAIAAGLVKGFEGVSESAVGDAYRSMKQLLVRKFGQASEVVKAVEGAEGKPESEARRGVLQEEVVASGASGDPELVAAALELLEQLRDIGGGAVVNVQQAKGRYIAQAGHEGHAEVHVRRPTGEPER